MANFTASLADPPLSDTAIISAAAVAAASSSSSSSSATADDANEDACSICLEPFTSQSPATVTCCKHEYHLQCILEWSQRSQECPICWQRLVLEDPACQELIAESVRPVTSRNATPTVSTNLPFLLEDYDVEQDSCSDESDIDEHIMHQLAAVARRARYVRLRERQRYSGLDHSQGLVYMSPSNIPIDQQMHVTLGEDQNLNYESSADSPTSAIPSAPSVANRVTRDALNEDGPAKQSAFFRQPPVNSPEGPVSSEMLSFSDSIKTKWFAASARYKESISKSTRDIKEKLIAHNNSVKELSKGVQREMSAGLAGVARMIDRLDLTPKRDDASGPVLNPTGRTSNFSWKGKAVTENILAKTLGRTNEQAEHDMTKDTSSQVSGVVSSHSGTPHIEGELMR